MTRPPSAAHHAFADQLYRSSDGSDLAHLRNALRENAELIAHHLFGDPNRAMSTAVQLRYGNNGSLAIETHGDQAGVWFDHSTSDGGGIFDLIMRERRCDFAAAVIIANDLLRRPAPPKGIAPPRSARSPVNHNDLVADLWAQTVPAIGTPVEQYLKGRGLFLSPEVADIAFHHACPCGSERTPAMVAAFRDIASNEICGLHRTFLNPDGTRIAGNAKMMLGRVAGAVIKLSPDDQVETGLHLAEGIETSIALLNFGFAPTWATGSAGGIVNFPVLPGIDTLSIAVDQDETGRKSSAACGERWRTGGKEVRFIHALADGADIADLAESGRV